MGSRFHELGMTDKNCVASLSLFKVQLLEQKLWDYINYNSVKIKVFIKMFFEMVSYFFLKISG